MGTIRRRLRTKATDTKARTGSGGPGDWYAWFFHNRKGKRGNAMEKKTFAAYLAAAVLLAALPGTAKAQTAFWTGNGGSGTAVTVTEPKGPGLSADEANLLPLVQSTVSGVFQRFSAMTVFDRQNLESILAEQELSLSGNFSDNDFIRIGQLTNARFVVFGSVANVLGSYTLELAVTDVETGERQASYPPRQVSLQSLTNLSAIRTATADLLGQLGVRLTAEALAELGRDEDQARIQAENALAKGIAAQRRGQAAQAMTYFFQAASFDPKMGEAISRTSVVSANAASGKMVANIQNRVQEYEDWRAVLTAAGAFYIQNMPFRFQYDSGIRNGDINFAAGTTEFTVAVSLVPDRNAWNTIEDLRSGFRRASRGEWNHVPADEREIVVPEKVNITVVMQLVNDRGEVISGVTYTFAGPGDKNRTNRELLFRDVSTGSLGSGELTVRVASINGMPAQEAGERGYMQISRANLWGTLNQERASAAFRAEWNRLRMNGKRGFEFGFLVNSGGKKRLYYDGEQHDQPITLWAGTLGYYWAPIPFIVLGLEARLGGTVSSYSDGSTYIDSDGQEQYNGTTGGGFYGTGAPAVGLVIPGERARFYVLGKMEMGTFGGDLEGTIMPYATPTVDVCLDLNIANFATGLLGGMVLKFTASQFYEPFFDSTHIRMGGSLGFAFRGFSEKR